MTHQNLWNTFAINTSNFDRYFVGSDQLAKKLAGITDTTFNTTYPPYNIKKIEDNKYVIEMAIAGFSKQDIELTLDENKLHIKGNITSDGSIAGDTVAYLYKGIADRAFVRSFTLADSVEIQDAQLLNGMLKVFLEHIIPESKKPKKIDISEIDKSAPKSKKFLSE